MEHNIVGWVKKLIGTATITMGSVGGDDDFIGSFAGESSTPRALDKLLRRLDQREFDLVDMGCALPADLN